MRLFIRSILPLLLLGTFVPAAPLSAADLTGNVINRTVKKPAAGDDVVLLKLSEGMQEVARTKTNAQGKFTLKMDDPSAPHLVRVNHRNVNYFRPAPPGTTSVEVEVFDADEKVQGIAQSLDIMRMEADATNLRVIEMIALSNTSNPPRTQMSAQNIELALPEGARIEESLAAGPGGMPVSSSPVPLNQKNHYAIIFPLRPGESRFQITYTLPYKGSATVAPVIMRPTESFAVSVPGSMQLKPASGSKLEAKGQDAGMNVFVANNAGPGQNVSFEVSGTGSVPLDNAQNSQSSNQGGDQAGGTPNRPGGGLGAPINTPDPLSKYKWWIIGVIAIALVAGAAYTMSSNPTPSATSGSGNALKDELFSLEQDRLEGKITPEEYAEHKAALDLLIKRQMKRKEG